MLYFYFSFGLDYFLYWMGFDIGIYSQGQAKDIEKYLFFV